VLTLGQLLIRSGRCRSTHDCSRCYSRQRGYP
jgi:hypothetical protein